jgi:hypothetical protein
MDDDVTPPDDAQPVDGKEKRKGNLLPPIRPGESRNPTGRNGRDKNKIIVDFLEALDKKDPEKRQRIQVLLESMYLRARMGHAAAMKYLAEQYTGKAKQQLELSNPDGSLNAARVDAVASQMRAAIAARRSDADHDPSQGGGGDAPTG